MKPFKGVISGWRKEHGRVHGVCVWHATYDNGITQDETMYTSLVVRMTETFGVTVLETENSIYVLINEVLE